ncbi:MAG: very short patch repair endonuclease [Candidatus Sericytochromatia bacterium]|uniref:Very short patch repair endonuclease n=1 Tax=Candidatus Tanganyikabacteria bacterium TaxID=2961651 RepID=A0A937X449_9BACT|nr:very short patch repair endonuclease [Candidatus Tanganyikabacteria bacterium]
MRAIKSKGTGPELQVCSLLHRAGLRFLKNRRPDKTRRCTADIVFPLLRLCVFVDGCFWHGCPRHFKVPRSNSGWWSEKISDNVRRDREKSSLLRGLGWTVVHIWEHELASEKSRTAAVRRIVRVTEKLRIKRKRRRSGKSA